VLLLHIFYGYAYRQQDFDFLPRIVSSTVLRGWYGVDLFFVLSGFLITGILLRSKGSHHYFRNFYIRRVLRIMPLYFVMVAVWSILYKGYGRYFLLSSFFGANLSGLFRISYPNGPGVLWSLAVEEHFYLLWPAIIFFLNRRALVALATAIVIGSPVLRTVYLARGIDPTFVYFFSWFRFDMLATGALIAVWAGSAYATKRNSLRVAVGLVVLAVISELLGRASGLTWTKAIVTATIFLLILALRGTSWTTPLRLRFC